MRAIITLCALAALAASPAMSAGQGKAAPGREKQTDTRVLELGAEIMQDMKPVEALNMYLDGFHFFADDMGRQMEAHHFCSALNEEIHQCAIYDGAGSSSRLIGVEYIISERLFRELPEEEKRLWHSHGHEVKSGQLVAPGVPDMAEHRLMEKLVTTYGKTWHTWDTHGHDLPVGIPALMMGFTADGQLRPEMLAGRDERLGVAYQEKRKAREDIPMPKPDPAANSWRSGTAYQLGLERKPFKGLRGK